MDEVTEGPKTQREADEAQKAEWKEHEVALVEALFKAAKAKTEELDANPAALLIASWEFLKVQFQAMVEVSGEKPTMLDPGLVSRVAGVIVSELVTNVIAPQMMEREELAKPFARA